MEIYTLAQWRRLRGLSQDELAAMVGITSRTIANYEKDVSNLGKASYEVVQRLAGALDVKLSQIFLGDTSEKPKQIHEGRGITA